MVSPQQARARTDAAMELHEAGELVAALEEIRDLLTVLSDGHDLTDPVLRESLFAARFEHAVLLTELGDLDAAAEAYALAARTPADLDDPDQRHEIALALLNRGICLDAVGEHAAAVAAYADLIARFADADDPVTADQVARARVNHAAALLALGRAAEAEIAAARVRDILDPENVLTSEQHVMAARLRAQALLELEQEEEALGELFRVHGVSREDPATRAQLAAAAQERAQLLADTSRIDDAIEVLDDALADAEVEPDPEVSEVLGELRETRRQLAGS